MYTTQNTRPGDALVERSAALVGNVHETLLVQALYPYSYEMQPGRQVSFEAGECFILVEKSNEDWWHVRRGEQDIYVPANYMSESRIDLGDDDTTDSQGEGSTLSPSSEDSYQDLQDETTKIEQPEEITSFGKVDSDRVYMNINDISERIYANIPVNSNECQQSMRRHYSTGEQQSNSNRTVPTAFPRPKSATLPSGWSVEVDSESGRPFYVNNKTNESTWRPPSNCSTSSEADSTRNSLSLPRGWRLEKQSAVDEYSYVNDFNNEKWQSYQDESGRLYFYNKNGETVWELPTYSDINEPNESEPTSPIDRDKRKLVPRPRMLSDGSHSVVDLRHKSPHLHLRSSRSASMLAGLSSLSNQATESNMSSFAKDFQNKPAAAGVPTFERRFTTGTAGCFSVEYQNNSERDNSEHTFPSASILSQPPV